MRVKSTDGVVLEVQDRPGLSGCGCDVFPEHTVLICHANGFHGRIFAPVTDALPVEWRRVTFDFRGHGMSSLPSGASLDWGAFAQDVLAVVDALGLRGCTAIGHSLVGAV